LDVPGRLYGQVATHRARTHKLHLESALTCLQLRRLRLRHHGEDTPKAYSPVSSLSSVLSFFSGREPNPPASPAVCNGGKASVRESDKNGPYFALKKNHRMPACDLIVRSEKKPSISSFFHVKPLQRLNWNAAELLGDGLNLVCDFFPWHRVCGPLAPRSCQKAGGPLFCEPDRQY